MKEGDGLTLIQALRKEGWRPRRWRDMGIGGKDPKTVNGKVSRARDQVDAALRKHYGPATGILRRCGATGPRRTGRQGKSPEGDLEAQAKAAARAEIEAEAKRADTRDMTEGQIRMRWTTICARGRGRRNRRGRTRLRGSREEDLNARSIDEVAEELGIPLKGHRRCQVRKGNSG